MPDSMQLKTGAAAAGHDPALAAALLQAVRAQDFAATPDSLRGGRPLEHFPSIDLAVAVFPPAGGGTVRVANVLFSREFGHGVAAAIAPGAGGLLNVRFDQDQRDAVGQSLAWMPGSDWSRLAWQPLGPVPQGRAGPDPEGRAAAVHRFVAPYPASLLKLMVAVGVALGVERGLLAWPEALEPMIVVSDNEATDRCVALLHRHGLVEALHEAFRARGLFTLQLNDTQPYGGWRNPDGAGVGHIHMTAWDTVRLLWLLDPSAPAAPWLPTGTPPLLGEATRAHLMGVLSRQQLDEVLSSGALRRLPGWVAGLPDAPAFAHKTGTTENFVSDGGVVRADGVHYAVCVLSNLGERYAPHPDAATTWRLPALGAAVHRAVRALR